MRKKLIEVALPLQAINEQSAREKSIRHGHPSTLHLWWARRPLAACRAVLFAQLVDDPDSDPRYKNMDPATRDQIAGSKRQQLFDLITELVRWENSNNIDVLNRARKEIARCIASRKIETGELTETTLIFGVNEGKLNAKGTFSDERITAYEMEQMLCRPEVVDYFLAHYGPPVLDPFAGGGSIPLEAQRLGLRAVASDLNPVAVLINKALIEIPPTFANLPPVHPQTEKKLTSDWTGAKGLAEDVRYYGNWMREEAEKRIGTFYPKIKITKSIAENRPDLQQYVGQELTVIAWIWARTVQCNNPACTARMPMVRSFYLSKKKDKEVTLKPIINAKKKTVHFEIEIAPDKIAPNTSDSTGATCLFCGNFMKKGPLRETASKHGMQEIPMAVVAEGVRGRVYLPFNEKDVPEIQRPKVPELQQNITDDKRWFSPPQYGLPMFEDLFTSRQLLALTTFSDLVVEAREKILDDMKTKKLKNRDNILYANAVATYLAFVVDKLADLCNSLNRWEPNAQCPRQLFARQAIPMVWDFAEGNPLSDSSGSWSVLFRNLEHAFNSPLFDFPKPSGGEANQNNAMDVHAYQKHPIIACDPPYYDNIGYADLSDFFYIWLRRSLKPFYPDLLATLLTPKSTELIASPYRHDNSSEKASEFFETGLKQTMSLWCQHGDHEYPTTIFYAFKQSETEVDGVASTGWETFLSGVIDAGFAITGTWPMRTEMGSRMVGQGTNALASSIVLSCVPRPLDASFGSQREFLNSLRLELPEALRKLQSGTIAPVDLAQAAIGPGMAIYSRYKKVVDAEGTPLSVRTALQLINKQLDEVLAEQDSVFDVETRWAIAWFEQFGSAPGPFGDAETFCKAKGTAVAGLVASGIVRSKGGVVQFIDRETFSKDWTPQAGKRLTEWEALQHLIFMYQKFGERGASRLMSLMSGEVVDRCLELSYRLYAVCERKKWPDEAFNYNSIVQVWIDLLRDARNMAKETQGELF